MAGAPSPGGRLDLDRALGLVDGLSVDADTQISEQILVTP